MKYKRLLSLTMAAAMLFGSAAALPQGVFETSSTITASAETNTATSGKCGENVSWSLSDDGVLTISGKGGMTDFGFYNPPWEQYCDLIESVVIDNGITNIGSYAFGRCRKLKNISIPLSVKRIGSSAFGDCDSLVNIEIPKDVEEIKDSVFMGCRKLTTISIPDGISSIPWQFCKDCESLKTVYIPKQIKSIGYDAFLGCLSLTSISVDSNNTSYSAIDGVLYNKDQTNLISCPPQKASLNIPNSVIRISENAFCYCSKLKSINLPNSVRKIGSYAFKECSCIETIDIPYGVTEIKTELFINCKMLKSVSIPNSITAIGYGAFWGCSSLSGVSLPNSVESLDSFLFAECTSLKKITIPSKIKQVSSYMFEGCTELEEIGLPEGLTTIGQGAFIDCIKLDNILLPSSLTNLSDRAFDGCNNLSRINIPDGVDKILYATFRGTNIKKIYIPDNVTEIDAAAFYDCNMLSSIEVESDNKYYSSIEGILYDKSKNEVICCPAGKDKVTLYNGITKIGHGSFWGCKSISSINIPKSVTVIDYNAFINCNSLLSIIIPETVISIENCAVGYYSQTNMKVEGFKIRCYKNTAGEKYAIDNSFDYELIDVKHIDAKPASCEKNGNIEYWIYNNNYYADDKATKQISENDVVIKATGHSWSNWITTKEATCTSDGSKEHTCSVCGKKETGTIAKLGHSWSDWTTTKKATCTADGSQERTCSVCGKKETQTIAKLGHSYKATVVKPTCTAKGYTLHKCSRCGDSYKDTYKDTVAHSWSDWTTTKKATCTAAGSKTRTCSVCKKSETATIAKLGHDYKSTVVKPTTSSKGYTLHKCTRCGYSYKDNYTDKLISLSGATIHGPQSSYTYTGKAIAPAVMVDLNGKTLTKGTDYTVTYKNNVNVGTATVTVTGKGEYTGSVTKTFKIVAKTVSISGAVIHGPQSSYTYTGKAIAPAVKVVLNGKTLTKGTDYTVTYKNNVKVGTATIVVTGKGNYTGSVTKTFKIVAKTVSISGATIHGPQSSYTYTGKAIAPAVMVDLNGKTLTKGTDYTVTYKNNIKVGTATIVVTGKGSYTGSVTKTFKIVAKSTSSFVWGKDNWNFNNSDYYPYYFSSGTYRSQINSTYLNKLKNNLTNSEYQAIFVGTWYSNAWLDDRWSGSCYGMSSTTLLAKKGLLPYSSYGKGATKLHDLTWPTKSNNISSLITYYQMLQVKDVIQQQIHTDKTPKESITKIISLLKFNSTVLVCFEKVFWGGHAILAYGYEYGSWTKNGVTYQGRIKICDPNSSIQNNENCYIYFNTKTYNWAIPYYSGITSSSGAIIDYVGANVNEINQGGYLSGKSSTKSSEYIARIDAASISDNRSVTKVKNINGNYIKQHNAPGDIVEAYSYILGGKSKGTVGYNLYDADSAYKVTQNNSSNLQLSIKYQDCRLTGGSAAGNSVIFDKNGFVSVNGESARFNISMTHDIDFPTDWFTVQVKGDNTNDASLKKVNNGWVVSADRLQNVEVAVNNKEDSAHVKFSTKYKSALIYEINKKTIGIAVDTDNNGTYETKVKTEDMTQTRLAGANRYETAAVISEDMYKNGTDTVIIATGLDFHDALVAVPLASAYDAPLLLTTDKQVTKQTEAELKRLKAKKVIIVSTNGAVGTAVKAALAKYDPTVISGKNCFETASKVATALQKKTGKAPDTIFFATDSAFADALSASPVAAIKNAPIIYLKNKGSIDSATANYLKSVKGKVKNAYVIGGDGVISDAMMKNVATALGLKSGKTVVRVAGANRYSTCVEVNNKFKDVLTGTGICVAKGLDFPDALAGGVYAAATKQALFLADGKKLQDCQNTYLKGKNAGKITVFGGTGAVPDSLVKLISKASV